MSKIEQIRHRSPAQGDYIYLNNGIDFMYFDSNEWKKIKPRELLRHFWEE